MRYVDLYLNVAGFALGQQRVLVTGEGPRWINLFSPFSLATGRIPARAAEKATIGETWPETGARDVIDVPLTRIARIARRRYRSDQRALTEARELCMSCSVHSGGRHRKKVRRLIQELERAARIVVVEEEGEG